MTYKDDLLESTSISEVVRNTFGWFEEKPTSLIVDEQFYYKLRYGIYGKYVDFSKIRPTGRRISNPVTHQLPIPENEKFDKENARRLIAYLSEVLRSTF